MNLLHDNLYNVNTVCAVVVSYNGGTLINDTIHALVNQVAKICIVDNQSDEETKKVLQGLEENGISVIYNDKNYGIAYALNQGVQFARSNGYQWLLTMDQDSIAKTDMVPELLGCATALSDTAKIVSLSPICVDEICTLDYYKSKHVEFEDRHTVITSGNLVRLNVFDVVGEYDNDLFIDSVDFDFCLRLKKCGYKIIRCYNSILYHSLGETKHIGRRIITEHSKLRKYYIARNHILITKKYMLDFPAYCLWKQLAIVKLFAQTVFFENNKLENMRYLIKGLVDGIMNIKGRIVDKKA